MKLAFFSGEHSHDEVVSVARRLRNASNIPTYGLLRLFLENATTAIKDEIRRLPPDVQRLVPPFEHILDWTEQTTEVKGTPLAEPYERVVLIVIKICCLIGYFSNCDHKYDLNDTGSVFFGLGVGVFIGAAISLSKNLSEVPSQGVTLLKTIFQIAFTIDRTARDLDTFDVGTANKNWIYCVLDTNLESVENALRDFQDESQTPATSRIFVCNARPLGISVSGPAARLNRMFEEAPFFRESNYIRMSCQGGPIHARHMFDLQTELDKLVLPKASSRLIARVVSPGTGMPLENTDAEGVYKQLVTYLMTQEVCWDKVCAFAQQELSGNSDTIYCFRPSQQVQDLVHSIGGEIQIVDLMKWVFEYDDGGTRVTSQAKLAIVGMSCRFPGADSTEAFWKLLESGREMHRQIPADRFDVSTHCDSTGATINASLTPFGCFIEEPGLFDPAFFNMSPREAEQTDPMQRLALVTAYEALERAGYAGQRTIDRHRVGSFYGCSSDDYREVNSGQAIGTYFIPGGNRAFGPGRINYFFGFSGPAYSIDTACSSGLAAIQVACSSIWAGDCDMVLAGGVNVLSNCDNYAGLSQGFFLSPTGNCKTWDSQADGYCRSDGVGTVVIKRLEHALSDNDNVLAVITAAASNQSAEAISITHPHAETQEHLFKQVVRRACIDPLEVDYVELHGTGTVAGDGTELKSVSNTFAPIIPRRRKTPLHIGAAKANVGHGEAAAGVISLIKTLLQFQRQAIPRHVGIINSLTPSFPADHIERNLHIPFETTSWLRKPDRKRLAIVNNFGAAGGNTCLALEDGPTISKTCQDARSYHIIAISAKNSVSFKRNAINLNTFLEQDPFVTLSDLAYTTTARRNHYPYRASFAVSSVAELLNAVQSVSHEDFEVRQARQRNVNVAFTFTGQGSFYPGMARELFDAAPAFRDHLLTFDSLAKRQGFGSFLPIVLEQCTDASLTARHLAIVCIEMALSRYLQDLGITPTCVIGHSLGEISALFATSVICAADAIFLLGQRARLLEQKTRSEEYGMLAVRCSLEFAEKNKGDCDIACINGPQDIVLAGKRSVLDITSKQICSTGVKTTFLDLSHGYHSEQMDSILDQYRHVAEGVVYHKPRVPVISPLLNKVVTDAETFNASYMTKATREAVNFTSALKTARQSGIVNDKTIWLEIGPHPICSSFIRSSIDGVAHPTLRRNESNWKTLAKTLCALYEAGVSIDWTELHRPYAGSLTLLDLPTYAFNNKNYWIQYEGTWALTRNRVENQGTFQSPTIPRELQSSAIHEIVLDESDKASRKLVVGTNILDPRIIDSVEGHAISMNSNGVMSCMVHGEVGYQVARYLFKLVTGSVPAAESIVISDFEYHEPVVSRKSTDVPQMIHTEGVWADNDTIDLRWFNVESGRWYAKAHATFETPKAMLNSWSRMSHLISSRIDSLHIAANVGEISKFSRAMVYRLFSQFVDWSEMFQGLQTVVLDRLEACAEVKLPVVEQRDQWYIPPCYLESFVMITAFIMNCSNALDNRKHFYITPGYTSVRFAKPLKPRVTYKSYAKMFQLDTALTYAGDVYVLEGEEVIGVIEGVQYRKWPMVMLSKFFATPETPSLKKVSASKNVHKTVATIAAPQPLAATFHKPLPQLSSTTTSSAYGTRAPTPPSTADVEDISPPLPHVIRPHSPPETPPSTSHGAKKADGLASRALYILADSTGLPINDLNEGAHFMDLGIDSLMSLVLAQRFRVELGVEVRDSLFVEFQTVGECMRWLESKE